MCFAENATSVWAGSIFQLVFIVVGPFARWPALANGASIRCRVNYMRNIVELSISCPAGYDASQ